VRAEQFLGLEFGGVDLILDNAGAHYLLEVNFPFSPSDAAADHRRGHWRFDDRLAVLQGRSLRGVERKRPLPIFQVEEHAPGGLHELQSVRPDVL
jgi:hypothetical protein